MALKRKTMKFLVPLTTQSLGRTDLTGRSVVPMYLNPQTFTIQDNKLITETLTKGGYAIEYWGEQLGEIQVSGTTGSGGIEAVNILRDIYRNEIIQFGKILHQRALTLQQNALSDMNNAGAVATSGAGIQASLDAITQGGFSGFENGVTSVIEEITSAARGTIDSNPASVELIPTIGAFATSMILYWQGEKFTGYFKNFKVDETAASPGIIDYQFTFIITKRTGRRSNFMPWHRSPVDAGGNPIPSRPVGDASKYEGLTFPATTQQSLSSLRGQQNRLSAIPTDSITSVFNETQESTNTDVNRVSINRNSSIRGN